MKKIVFPTFLFTIVLIGSANARAQFMTVELNKPFLSSHSAAIIVDRNDDPIPGASVKSMSVNWKTVIESTLADVNGRIRFKRNKSNLYYLEITHPGFQVMHVKLKIVRRKTKEPRIEIEIAT